MNNDLDGYLRGKGFARNPFQTWVANDEAATLSGYFVEPPNFARIRGTLGRPAPPLLVFGERGSGKSATATVLAEYVTAVEQTGVVNVNVAMLDGILAAARDDLTQLSARAFRAPIWAAAHRTLPHAIADPPPDPAIPLTVAAGYTLYVLVDGLDELPATVANPHAMAQLITPMLTDWVLLSTPRVIYKFFLPSAIQPLLMDDVRVRRDRFDIVTAQEGWSDDQLMHLLQKRLDYFSDGKVTSIGSISDAPDSDMRLCVAAQGSPRNLLRLCAYLLDAHTQNGLHWMIKEATLDQAIARLTDELDGTPPRSVHATADNTIIAAPTAIDAPHAYSALLWLHNNDVFIGNRRVVPTPAGQELMVLQMLYARRGETCSKDALIEHIYGPDSHQSDENLYATIKRTAKKLDLTDMHRYIETVRSVGFRLINYDEPRKP